MLLEAPGACCSLIFADDMSAKGAEVISPHLGLFLKFVLSEMVMSVASLIVALQYKYCCTAALLVLGRLDETKRESSIVCRLGLLQNACVYTYCMGNGG